MQDAPREIDRRNFLRRSASAIAFGAATVVLPAARAQEPKPVEDLMRVPGTLPRPYGERSPFEKHTRLGGTLGAAWMGRQFSIKSPGLGRRSGEGLALVQCTGISQGATWASRRTAEKHRRGRGTNRERGWMIQQRRLIVRWTSAIWIHGLKR